MVHEATLLDRGAENYFFWQKHPLHHKLQRPPTRPRHSSRQEPTSFPRLESPDHVPYLSPAQSRRWVADRYCHRRPPSPLSPSQNIMEKPSLPSISTLLHLVESEETPSHNHNLKRPASPQSRSSLPGREQFRRLSPPFQTFSAIGDRSGSNDVSSNQLLPGATRTALPLTPPTSSEPSTNSMPSPATTASHSPYTRYQLYNPTQMFPVTDPTSQRQSVPPASIIPRYTDTGLASQAKPSSPYGAEYGEPTYAHSAPASSPGASSLRSFHSPGIHEASPTTTYFQRPLPTDFPPPVPPLQLPAPTRMMPAGSLSPSVPSFSPSFTPRSSIELESQPHQQPQQQQQRQHHHYISPSSASSFPQMHDRYICPTCHKAFSRPSSLRIHSHSHSGEKPFRCPHSDCGKSFSVRSNMKRHERGCHAGSQSPAE